MTPLRPLPTPPVPAHPYRARIWANHNGEIHNFANLSEAVDHFLDHDAEPDRAVIFNDDGMAREYSANLISLIRDARKEADEWGRHVSIEAARGAGAVMSDYLVWSNEHRAWWRPDRRGYTPYVARAGRYSRAEAMGICIGSRDGWTPGSVPPEIPVLESDAIEAEISFFEGAKQ